MTKKPLVSFITLSFNRKNELLSLLSCFKNQHYKNIETIVVENASKENFTKVIEKKFPKTKIVKLKKNKGIAGYNYGMREARGEIFILIDNDCEIDKDLCQKTVNYFQKNKNLDIIAFKIGNYYKGGFMQIIPHKNAGNPDKGYEALTFNGNGCAMKREVFEKIGGFYEDYFIYCSEYEYGVRALEAGFDIRYFPDIVIEHKNASSDIRSSGKANFYIARNWIYFIFEFLPFVEFPKYMPFFSKNFSRRSADDLGKIRFYLLGIMVGLINLWKIFPRRKTVKKDTLMRIEGGILGKHGYVYTW